jgi:hypothetical protein
MRPLGDVMSVCCAIAGKQRSNAAIVLKILVFMLSVLIGSLREFTLKRKLKQYISSNQYIF